MKSFDFQLKLLGPSLYIVLPKQAYRKTYIAWRSQLCSSRNRIVSTRRHLNSGQNHGQSFIQKWGKVLIFGKGNNKSKLHSRRSGEVETRLNSRNAFYHSVPNTLSYRLVSKSCNATCCFRWVWSFRSRLEGRTCTEGPWDTKIWRECLDLYDSQ